MHCPPQDSRERRVQLGAQSLKPWDAPRSLFERSPPDTCSNENGFTLALGLDRSRFFTNLTLIFGFRFAQVILVMKIEPFTDIFRFCLGCSQDIIMATDIKYKLSL